MSPMPRNIGLPPILTSADGHIRCVGIELELGGLDIEALTEQVRATLGGSVERISEYERLVHSEAHGDWRIELDFALLKRLAREAEQPDGVPSRLTAAAEELVRAGVQWIVPLEVISPPLPIDRLSIMDGLVPRLREAGARGSTDAFIYAFGLQFNPELPATDADTIASYLKAFACLYDWLETRADIDVSRRLTLYADPFPNDYVKQVVATDYWPELGALIDDYLAANPTRNRALDCLPLFLHLAPARVRAVISDPRVKPRPTLHYRLPNCEIHRPEWGIAIAWNDWLQVEYLAADRARLEALCACYGAFLRDPLNRLFGSWVKELQPWLTSLSDP